MLPTLSLLALIAADPAQAQDRGARGDDAAYAADDGVYVPPPRDRLWYTNATFARVNPLGLVDVFKVGWRRRLSTKDSILFQDTYIYTGPIAMVTPAYSRLGWYGEAQLLSVLRFFGQVEGVGYYGTFDQVIGWNDPRARYSDQTIESLSDQARAETGWVLTFGGTLRAKVGPIAARSTLSFMRYDLALEDDEQFFYDQLWDRLAPDGGFMALNDFDVLYVKNKLRLGVRYTWSDTLDGRGKSTDGALSHHRVGPLFAWQFKDKGPGAKFNQPTLFVLAQWWLQHPYRAGQEQPQGLPLIAIGFAFNGDLKTSEIPQTPQPPPPVP